MKKFEATQTEREESILREIIRRGLTIEKVERKSDREFDLLLEGTIEIGANVGRVGYAAWLPLLAIREFVTWTCREIANRTDYPEMTYSGDWSGVRDSSSATIWDLFEREVVEAVCW